MIDFFEKRNIQVVVWTVNNDFEKSYFGDVLKCSYITDTVSPKFRYQKYLAFKRFFFHFS